MSLNVETAVLKKEKNKSPPSAGLLFFKIQVEAELRCTHAVHVVFVLFSCQLSGLAPPPMSPLYVNVSETDLNL